MPGGGRIIAPNLEQMDQCIARRQLLKPEIRAWLTGAKIPSPPKTAKHRRACDSTGRRV